jgi:hypothetical protein
MTRHSGPALGEHCAAVGLDFAEREGAHSCSLESETEATDAAEEVEDIQAAPAVNWSRWRLSPSNRPLFTGSSGIELIT